MLGGIEGIAAIAFPDQLIQVDARLKDGPPGHGELGLAAAVGNQFETVVEVPGNPEAHGRGRGIPLQRLFDSLIIRVLIEMNPKMIILMEICFEYPDLIIEQNYLIYDGLNSQTGAQMLLYDQLNSVRGKDLRKLEDIVLSPCHHLLSSLRFLVLDELQISL